MDRRRWNGQCILDSGIVVVFGSFRGHTHVCLLRQEAASKNGSKVPKSFELAFQVLDIEVIFCVRHGLSARTWVGI